MELYLYSSHIPSRYGQGELRLFLDRDFFFACFGVNKHYSRIGTGSRLDGAGLIQQGCCNAICFGAKRGSVNRMFFGVTATVWPAAESRSIHTLHSQKGCASQNSQLLHSSVHCTVKLYFCGERKPPSSRRIKEFSTNS